MIHQYSNGCLQVCILGVIEPDANGARGLLEAVVKASDCIKVDCNKVVGIMTDGESANTGKQGGLWKLLQDHWKKMLITVWCTCHRSDLAMEAMENVVPELTVWRSNYVALATYFHTSKCRTKALNSVANVGVIAFKAHHDVRFTEHLHNFITAVNKNFQACHAVFKATIDNPEATQDEKAKCSGFQKLWCEGSIQVKIMALMYDIYDIFK